MKRILIITALGVIATAGITAAIWQTIDPTPRNETSEPRRERGAEESESLYKVAWVADGDTFNAVIEGESTPVRLIGIDAPETKHAEGRETAECFAEEARERAVELLRGERVRLEQDRSRANRDEYDRVLAYVYLEDGRFVNKILLEEGFARELTFRGVPYKYQKTFQAAESRAREAQLGLWAEGACE